MINELTLKQLRKQYTDTAVFLLDQFPKKEMLSIPTGSMLLDKAIGVGGIPRGRYTEIYGEDGSGKTTLCQHIVANAQKQGLTCAFIDVENVIDVDYAKACGVDFGTLYLSQPDFQEEALGIAELLIKSGDVGVVIIDSVAALTPEKEGEDEFGDKIVTGLLRAKLMKVFFRRTVPYIRRNDVAVVFTNQLIDNTKSMWGGTKPTGGRGIKHYTSLRISINKKYQGEIKTKGNIVGQDISYVIIKNKVGKPLQTGEFTILFGHGIDRATNILSAAIEFGLVNKRGSYYTHEGETLAQGRAGAISTLRENTELVDSLEKQCREMLEVS